MFLYGIKIGLYLEVISRVLPLSSISYCVGIEDQCNRWQYRPV